jgi:NitT/TauT family transport system ATP-binding protein
MAAMPFDAGMPLLSVEGVTVRYKTATSLVTATLRVDVSAARGERVVLLGPSGCGKSTLLKCVGGFIPPTEGRITLAGRTVGGPGPDRMMVFQEFDQLLPWKTVRGNIEFPLAQARGDLGRAAIRDRAAFYMEKVGLARFAGSYPHQLSGGMKQRVAIARAMAMEPEILLMDEPFASLDALTRRHMQDELLRLWADTRFTLLFVTHSIEEAVILGSRIVVLSPHPGRVRAVLDADQAMDDALGQSRAQALREEISALLLTDRFENGGGI